MLTYTAIASEACPLLSRNKQSLEFILTSLFMKIFRTASPAVVTECQRTLCFLPITLQIFIMTAKFLEVFVATENSLLYRPICYSIIVLLISYFRGSHNVFTAVKQPPVTEHHELY